MDQLLSFKSLRCLKIAENLIIEHDYISFKIFQEMNQCSNKTVYDDIKYLQDEWNEILELDLIKNHARSNVTSLYSLMHIKRKLFYGEIKVQLILNIFFNPGLDMIEHSLALNFSDSHLRSQLNSINLFLKKYDIFIKYNKDTKGYIIDAKDKSVLMIFILELIKVSQNEHLLPDLKETEAAKFEVVINSLSKFIPEQLTNESMNLARINQFLLSHFPNVNVGYTSVFNTYERIVSREAFFENHLREYFKRNDFLIPDNEFEIFTDILLMVGTKLSLMPQRVDNFLNRYDYFYSSYKIEQPNRAKEIDLMLSFFEEETGIKFYSYRSEIVFYAHTHLLSMRSNKKIKIGIYSDMGKNHALSIVGEIKKKFTNHIVNAYQQNGEYDLILTTTDLRSDINLFDIKYLVISDYITDEDIFKIHKEISQQLKS